MIVPRYTVGRLRDVSGRLGEIAPAESVAAACGIPTKTVEALAAHGQIRQFRPGDRRLYDLREVLAVLGRPPPSTVRLLASSALPPPSDLGAVRSVD